MHDSKLWSSKQIKNQTANKMAAGESTPLWFAGRICIIIVTHGVSRYGDSVSVWQQRTFPPAGDTISINSHSNTHIRAAPNKGGPCRSGSMA